MEKICEKCKKAFKFDNYEYSEPSFCSDNIEYHVVHCPHCDAKNYTQEVHTKEYITEKYYKKYYSKKNKHENADVALYLAFIGIAIVIVFFLPFIF